MGIELERFVNTIDDELKCTICCGVLENPVQISECEHTFCSNCIEEWISRQSTCPIDRRELTSDDIKPASRLLNSFLSRLSVRCNFNEMGCNSIVTLESLASHVNQCNFNPDKAFPCEKGCGVLLTIKQKSDHNCVLEDILVTIESQNERIRKLEKLLEKNHTITNKRIETLEKMCESMEEIANKCRTLENKYEQLISNMSNQSSSNLCRSNLAIGESINRSSNSLNAENTPNQETVPQAVTGEEKSSIFRTINVEVDHKLKTIQLWANIYEPIRNIKRRISEKESMTVQSQCLFYGDQLLSDDKSLSEYSIASTNFVLVKRPIKIDIIIFTENISLSFEPYETISNIKERLRTLRGLNVSLSYFGQILDDNRTIYSYKIRDRAKLKVTAIDCGKDKGRSLPRLTM